MDYSPQGRKESDDSYALSKTRGLHSYSPNVENVSHSGMSQLFTTPGTVACQSPSSMGFSRQEYWRGVPFPSPGDLPDPGIKPRSPKVQANALPSEPPGKPFIL